MFLLISTYTCPFFDFCLKLYCFMICSGKTDRVIRMYSKRSNRVHG